MAHPNRHIVHYIPPAKFPDMEVEFVNPVPDDYFIHWMFRYRCMECRRAGEEINEILPRARSKKAIMDWRNRVLLCRGCHDKFHANGVTIGKMNTMREHRREYLISVGRGAYV